MSRTQRWLPLLLAGLAFLPSQARAQAPAAADPVAETLRGLPLAGLPVRQDVAGLTASGRPLRVLEPHGNLDPSRPRLVLIGGLDGSVESREAVLGVLRWWFADPAAERLRQGWHLAALPCARPDVCGSDAVPGTGAPALIFPPGGPFFDGKQDGTPHAVWRWTTMQGPSLVVEVRVGWPRAWEANELARSLVPDPAPATPGSLAAALGSATDGPARSARVPAVRLTARPSVLRDVFIELLDGAVGVVSPQRIALQGRVARRPLDVARMLALKYPGDPGMSYIPALSWSGALKVAELTGEPRYRTKPQTEMAPFLSGQTPAVAEPYLLTSLAGHLAFADLAAHTGDAKAAALAQNAADFMLGQGAGPTDQGAGAGVQGSGAPIGIRFRRGWTDDMFMATSVLARVAALTGDDRYAAPVGRLLTGYATDLQRPDGLFVHAKDGPHAWGRGNGFAAFGLMDALTHLPAAWSDRARVLQSYRALMNGLVAHQAPDGMWRQVVDEPGSYREFTVTAMVLTAMARGVRLGWIDAATFRPVVDRAWRGLLQRIAEDGTLMDVCTGTGSGPTKEYYLNRAGLTGADDRGGAMGLTAAIEMHALLTR
jgi:rhamnogalacturonyl hydrolase YesR